MKKRVFAQCLSILLLISSNQLYASKTTHWGYEDQIGPTHWGALSPSFEQCQAGKNQTPINITHVVHTLYQHPLNINYKISPQDVMFNGHTVQINTKEKDLSDYVKIDGEKYALQQFHFHTPSENQIEGKSFPLELHFVNANAQGELAVVAVMFNLGKANPEWDKFWQDLSPTPEQKATLQLKIDLEKLIPKQQHYYRFSGSLTTPPCTEGVIWMVLREPLTISQQQLDQFKLLLKAQPNNRPIQPRNGRIIIAN